MLKIFNDLRLFLEDNYREISVREYARVCGISPPSASKLLAGLEREGILKRRDDRNYIFYKANRESNLFVLLLKAYWLLVFGKIGLLGYLEKELVDVAIVFGSFSKGEITASSDIDLAVFSASRKKLDLGVFEKKLKRKIQIFSFCGRNDVGDDLLNSILNGFVVLGGW